MCPSQCLNIFLLFVNEDLFQGFPGYLTSPASVGANVLDSLLQRPLVHNWVRRCHKGLANDSIFMNCLSYIYFQKGMESVLLEKSGGQAAVLVPGGAPEALNCDKGEVGGGVCSRSGQGVR